MRLCPTYRWNFIFVLWLFTDSTVLNLLGPWVVILLVLTSTCNHYIIDAKTKETTLFRIRRALGCSILSIVLRAQAKSCINGVVPIGWGVLTYLDHRYKYDAKSLISGEFRQTVECSNGTMSMWQAWAAIVVPVKPHTMSTTVRWVPQTTPLTNDHHVVCNQHHQKMCYKTQLRWKCLQYQKINSYTLLRLVLCQHRQENCRECIGGK